VRWITRKAGLVANPDRAIAMLHGAILRNPLPVRSQAPACPGDSQLKSPFPPLLQCPVSSNCSQGSSANFNRYSAVLSCRAGSGLSSSRTRVRLQRFQFWSDPKRIVILSVVAVREADCNAVEGSL